MRRLSLDKRHHPVRAALDDAVVLGQLIAVRERTARKRGTYGAGDHLWRRSLKSGEALKRLKERLGDVWDVGWLLRSSRPGRLLYVPVRPISLG